MSIDTTPPKQALAVEPPVSVPRADDVPVMSPGDKYRAYLDCFPVELPDRTWPEKRITEAPIWCSVDLRDGNQALIHPMNIEQKLELFKLLCDIGFKEIEIGFPSAAQVEFDFCRILIEQGKVPEDVYPQVLTQARSHLIERSFEALQGAKQAILHIYNSTSELQRRVVFHASKAEITGIAVRGVELVRRLSEKTDTHIALEYSPESFTGTELPYALEVCEAVIDVWEPSPARKIILNLPATVEMATPNVYADRIEWFLRNVKDRESVILSLHPHNDRGTAVAAAELALMAGADRIEGTLFGNGERTGNVDIVTLALNMYSQGIDPKLDFHDINAIRRVTDGCTELPVHPRHPYAGDLVFTAFSGSHQDAISKGMRARQQASGEFWEVPYLPIDPQDLGRTYEKIIQINSQSGKGGVAYVMDTGFQRRLPKAMQPEFAAIIQRYSEETGAEVSPETISTLFASEFLEAEAPFRFLDFRSWSTVGASAAEEAVLTVEVKGERRDLAGIGNGPIDAAKAALLGGGCPYFEIIDYREHARSSGSDADAIAYMQIETKNGVRRYGAGIDANTVSASIKSLLSALNRALQEGKAAPSLGEKRYVAEQYVKAMQDEFGCRLPAAMHAEFSEAIEHSEIDGIGATAAELWDVFTQEYLRLNRPYRFGGLRSQSLDDADAEECWLSVEIDGQPHELHGTGNGPVNACVRALVESGPVAFDVVDFHEDSLGKEPPGEAIAYLQIELPDGVRKFGVGIDRKPSFASIKALLSALNRAAQRRAYAHAEFIDVMHREFKCELPVDMHREFLAEMQQLAANPGAKVAAAAVWNAFAQQYLDRSEPYRLLRWGVASVEDDPKQVEVSLTIDSDGEEQSLSARGERPLAAACRAILAAGCPPFEIVDFHEHARGSGADAEAVAFVQVRMDGIARFGAGLDRSTTRALIKAMLSAVNRQLAKQSYPPSEAIHVLQTEFGCELPETMYPEFRELIQQSIEPGGSMPASFIWGLFSAEFLERTSPHRFVGFHAYPLQEGAATIACSLTLEVDGKPQELQGTGNGPIDACVNALRESVFPDFRLTTFEEHARTSGADAEAVAYIQIEHGGSARFGVGIDPNTTRAAIKALLAAINRC